MSKRVDHAKVLAMYAEGKSTSEIAQWFGVQTPAITRIAAKIGVVLKRGVRPKVTGVPRSPSIPRPNGYHSAAAIAERANASLAAKARVEADAVANYAMREPCQRCGTRRDRHAEFGCRRYKA